MMQPAPDQNGRIDRPRFRQDLVAEPIEEQGGRFIDVMDPDSGNLFRFYEVEYSLACAMDGERDVAGIVKWAQEELGLTPSPQEVRTVIATLGDLGFIATGDAAAPEAPELGVGVVAPPPAAYASDDVELGTAGAAGSAGSGDREGSAPSRREPPAPAVTLGAPGAAPTRRPAEPVEDIALGNPGRGPARATPAPPIESTSEVSLDLADHIAVRRDDVKEAVRASKVMNAVDVPQDLLDALEDKPSAKPAEPSRPEPREAKKPEPRVEAKRPEPKAEPRVEPKAEARPEPKPVAAAKVEPRPEPKTEPRPEPKAEPRVDTRPVARVEPEPAPPVEKAAAPTPSVRPPVAKPPVELPKPPVIAEKATQPTAPRSGVSPLLIVLLILAVVGAGGFVVWKYVLQKPTADRDTSLQPAAPAPVPVVPPAPPPAPPAPTAKVALEAPAAEDIKLASASVVETILPDKSVVKDGDVVVKLVGDKPIEAEITAATRELKTLQDRLEATTKKLATAKAGGNKAGETQAEAELADRQKALDVKKAQHEAKTADLEKFVIHAKGNGTFTPAAKQGQKLAAGAVVASLQRDATPVATFKVSDVAPYATGTSVELALGKGEQHVACTVAEVQGDSVKVSCPADPALTDGADVTLKLPGAAPAATPPAAGAGATGAETPAAATPGSGAAPEAPAGASTDPAGSAAAPASADPATAPSPSK